MSPRRPFRVLAPLAGLLGVAAVGLGLRDWPLDGARAGAFADRALAPYGLGLAARGPVRLTLLPRPHLTFDGAAVVAGRGGPALAEGGRLSLDLDPVALLGARAAVDGLRLDGARLSPDPDAWAGPLARVADLARAGVLAARRVSLAAARVGDGAAARDIDLDLAWPRRGGSVEARASLTWRGVPARLALSHLRPAELAAGRPSPFTAGVSWPDGDLALDGSAAYDGAAAPNVTGRARFETRSLPETLAWIGRPAPLAQLAGAFTLDGGFEFAGGALSWPRLRVALGSNVLEGAGSVTPGSGAAPRPAIQATLAGDTVNLAPLLGALVRLFEPEAPPLALRPLTAGGDLDLRLSTAAARLGPIQVDDLAASVLVRDASVEVAVNRARVQGGLLKGRVVLAAGADPGETEMRAQGSLDRVDLGGLLGALGEARWITGPLQGQFALEGAGRDAPALIARLGGRAALSIDGGAITGLDLADVVRRGGGVAPGPLARRNGRTAFERAAVSLRVADGVAELVDAGLRGPGVGATLRGRLSLPDLRLDAQGDLALRPPADPAHGLAFEISGPLSEPLDALAVRVAPHAGGRDEAADPAARPAEPAPPGPLGQTALPGGARAYAP